MKGQSLLLLVSVSAWGMSTYIESPGSLPQAVTLPVPIDDLDGDGIRDRRDPIIDFGKLSPRYAGDYGLNVRALSWDPGEFLTCLDDDCRYTNFPQLVTVPDGGAFVLFHVPENTNGDFRPWNAGSVHCGGSLTFRTLNPDCWADFKRFESDPLVVEITSGSRTLKVIRLSAL